MDLGYMDSGWADSGALKRSFVGIGDVQLPGRSPGLF